MLSQNPRLQKQFDRLLADLKKGIKRLDNELIKIEKECGEESYLLKAEAEAQQSKIKESALSKAVRIAQEEEEKDHKQAQ